MRACLLAVRISAASDELYASYEVVARALDELVAARDMLKQVADFADWLEDFATESEQYSDGKNFAAGKIEGSRGTARCLRDFLKIPQKPLDKHGKV